METDIVITTRGRLEYLTRTVDYILVRTHSPFRLHVIDDATEDSEHTDYLLDLWKTKVIDTLVLHNTRCGLRANRNIGFWLTFSDPMVMTDDDVLCPDVEPDWLARGLTEMKRIPSLGVLALNNPSDNAISATTRQLAERDGNVQFCKKVGGTFCFIRRKVREGWALPHNKDEKVHSWISRRSGYPATSRNNHALNIGLRVGYLVNTFCQHIGEARARDGKNKDLSYPVVEPVDPMTLRPPEELAF